MLATLHSSWPLTAILLVSCSELMQSPFLGSLLYFFPINSPVKRPIFLSFPTALWVTASSSHHVRQWTIVVLQVFCRRLPSINPVFGINSPPSPWPPGSYMLFTNPNAAAVKWAINGNCPFWLFKREQKWQDIGKSLTECLARSKDSIKLITQSYFSLVCVSLSIT